MTPTPHSTNRLFEWAVSVILFLIGLSVPLSPLFGLAPPPGIEVFSTTWLGVDHIGWLLAVIGWLRCGALYANGTWKEYGCYLRTLGAAAGIIVWIELLYGAVVVTVLSGLMYISVIFFAVFVVFEAFSLVRSLVDRGHYARVSANAARPT